MVFIRTFNSHGWFQSVHIHRSVRRACSSNLPLFPIVLLELSRAEFYNQVTHTEHRPLVVS